MSQVEKKTGSPGTGLLEAPFKAFFWGLGITLGIMAGIVIVLITSKYLTENKPWILPDEIKNTTTAISKPREPPSFNFFKSFYGSKYNKNTEPVYIESWMWRLTYEARTSGGHASTVIYVFRVDDNRWIERIETKESKVVTHIYQAGDFYIRVDPAQNVMSWDITIDIPSY